MSINLSSYKNIETGLFVSMVVPDYATLKFSDQYREVTLNGDTYLPLGNLLGISDTNSELVNSSGEVTLTISGIPNTSISEIVNNKIKGSKIKVWRAFFDSTTKDLLNITGNPVGRFQGIVTNYSLEEDYSPGSSDMKNTILLVCTNNVAVLGNKISGRRTNYADHRALYPTDPSMDRVSKLATTNFNFGAPV